MAYFLMPRCAPSYQASQCNPFGSYAPVSRRPAYTYSVSRPQPHRPAYSSFNHFFSQVDELLSSIDREAQRQAQIEAQREAQREADRQQQQRQNALRARFAVSENGKGWQLDGDVHGFEQENISIEITDERTVKVVGNTEWRAEAEKQQEVAADQHLTEGHEDDKINDTSVANAETQSTLQSETETVRSATPSSSTESHKSYQAFVEDDFEDLGAEASSLFSAPSDPSSTTEPKDAESKEKSVDEAVKTGTVVAQQLQAESPAQPTQQRTENDDRVHGSFEQVFTFPERIDGTNVSATFKDGVLRITVPRASAPQIRRIALL
ncbi:HSP20-like chaperone [Dothidotthia symphoricarpi CBS 119687]|uniref:HSP20-like chaperone n=1 Tax=Dothidotthia symphoricarpi CBS 119687 TaxID=1392245 RepID=A0A6A6A6D9_9PLEO|nr:HSP20-like chaperone [Dothidotthia symphoricarpi CBS 119687]KAF2127449.1 HSP20-like chaperone [Dothidotthia symphoricarpi CBS 119687]